jgi:PIN domain nuclease of toxin-antitoxin system
VFLASVVSMWEVFLSRHKQDMQGLTQARLLEAMQYMGGRLILLDEKDTALLPTVLALRTGLGARGEHKDPFDHILIAQAIRHNAAMVSLDRQFPAYANPPRFRLIAAFL